MNLVRRSCADMLVVIEQVIDPVRAEQMRSQLLAAHWIDGRHTAGALAVDAKRNRQIADDDMLAQRIAADVEQAVRANVELQSAALPRRLLSPRFNRHGIGEYYDAHVDAALMRTPNGELLRTDVSATLFLSSPTDYDGGELEIETGFGVQEVKLAAGDLVLYPATSLHRVAPVTRGERICCFFWIESMVGNAERRALLYELDLSIRTLRKNPAENGPTITRLVGVYHNLVRTWASD